MSKPIKLELHRIYGSPAIEAVIDKYELHDKDGYNPCTPDTETDIMSVGETYPLYFPDGNLAYNFILHTNHPDFNRWRCIYVCASLSATGKREV